MEISKKINFFELCEKLEKIQSSPNIAQKEKKTKQVIASFLEFSKQFCKDNGNDCNSSIYCLLRCLIPNSDNARDSYGIQIPTLGKIYIKILHLAPGGSDERQLLQQSHSNGPRSQHLDYADILYKVLKLRTTNTPSELTLFDIHEMLDTISVGRKRANPLSRDSGL